MIRNITNNKIISKEKTILRDILPKAKGLMLSKPKTLVFVFDKEKFHYIHMFFVFYPINIIFLNQYKEVIEIKKLLPFSIYRSKRKSKYFIELPLGRIKDIKIGDKIEF